MERQTEGIVEKIGRERTVAGAKYRTGWKTDQGSSGKLLFTLQATPRVSEKSLQKQIELKLYTKLCWKWIAFSNAFRFILNSRFPKFLSEPAPINKPIFGRRVMIEVFVTLAFQSWQCPSFFVETSLFFNKSYILPSVCLTKPWSCCVWQS